MNTKLIMSVSALLMAVLGFAASFLPHELLQYLGAGAAGIFPLFVQLLGAMYLGFAIMNWMAKGVLIGGIYARPLAMGNFLHFLVGAMALLKEISAYQQNLVGWMLAAIYVLLAALFGFICFRHPLKSDSRND